MSALTPEQEAAAARQDEVYRARCKRANTIIRLAADFKPLKRTRGAEHSPLLAVLNDTNRALFNYEENEQETEVGLYAVYAEVFEQTAARLDTLTAQRELAANRAKV